MNRLVKLYQSTHPTVWFLLVGTVLTRISTSMTLPFLALYLLKQTDMTPAAIGMAIGAASLTGMFAGFIGGNLSDQFGRRKVMLFAMFMWAIVFLGFGMATHIWMFFVLSALNGLCRAFFEPTGQAMMADLTPPEQRQRIFSMRYMAINVGASVGPLVGAYMGIASTETTFFMTATVNLLYAFGILLWVKESYDVKANSGNRTSMREAISMLVKDGALAFFLLAGILVNLGYSQMESTLPQYAKFLFGEQGAAFYAWMIAVNGVTVVLLQIPISRFGSRWTPLRQMMFGSFLFAAGYVGFGTLTSLPGLMVSMVVLTLGEILIMPIGMVFLDNIAPEHLRGSYFGAGNLRSLGFSLGPALGGLLMTLLGASAMFYTMAVIVLGTVFLYFIGNSIYIKRQSHILEPGIGNTTVY